MRLKHSWLLLVLLGGVVCTDATPGAHGVVMDSLATVVLTEPDSTPVTQTLASFHAGSSAAFSTRAPSSRS